MSVFCRIASLICTMIIAVPSAMDEPGNIGNWRIECNAAGYDSFILVQANYCVCSDASRTGENEDMSGWPIVCRLGVEDVSGFNVK